MISKAITETVIKIFQLFRNGYGNAMAGLFTLQKSKGTDPSECPHFRTAERRFQEEDLDSLYSLCKQIVELYENRQ